MNLRLKTLLDRDQYVTALENSPHLSDIYFGDGRRQREYKTVERGHKVFQLLTSSPLVLNHRIFSETHFHLNTTNWPWFNLWEHLIIHAKSNHLDVERINSKYHKHPSWIAAMMRHYNWLRIEAISYFTAVLRGGGGGGDLVNVTTRILSAFNKQELKEVLDKSPRHGSALKWFPTRWDISLVN